MDREHLIAALGDVGQAGQAGALCRRALIDGAELVLLPGTVPTAALREIYRSRAEHLRQRQVPAIGADEAADRLERTDHATLRIGSVDGGAGSHFFQLFLEPIGGQVVACLAVPDQGEGTETSVDGPDTL